MIIDGAVDKIGMSTNHNSMARTFGRYLRSTPLHPQWLIYRKVAESHVRIGELARGHVLDVGCADQQVKSFLDKDCEYFGLDNYKTAVEWYDSRPNVYASACSIPFQDNYFDTVLLIDVIEHLSDPGKSMSEIKRVLKEDGKFVLQAPFMYPIHDAPLDFMRWTMYGVKKLALDYGLEVVDEDIVGSSAETIGMLANVAIADSMIFWFESKSYALILAPVMLPLIPLFNGIAWLTTWLRLAGGKRNLMPMEYRLVLVKKR